MSIFLDEYLYPDGVRIDAHGLSLISPIDNQYFIREKSIRKIFSYIKEIGYKYTYLKIQSRLKEKSRNKKYLSIGIGTILESRSSKFLPGQLVVFIAYNHPKLFERAVIHHSCLSFADKRDFHWIKNNVIEIRSNAELETQLAVYKGWSPFSGYEIPPFSQDLIDKLITFWKMTSDNITTIHIKKNKMISEKMISKKTNENHSDKKAVLFGLGNYAKTIILPNLDKRITIHKIHEIDPTQLSDHDKKIHYDTSPYPREDDTSSIYFISGYHHMHAEIAIEGLSKNKDVVIEKPLVTTTEDLKKLTHTLKHSQGKLYACFQRRYLACNEMIFDDFDIKRGDPISYFSTIYEESLPEKHWYRWPNSRGTIVSNGCHWIDHFLFLNNYSNVSDFFSYQSAFNEYVVLVQLENGALLNLAISHQGSPRIGMQEYIELRSGKNTAKIVNGRYYTAENSIKIIRKLSMKKFDAYQRMYQMISKNIVEGNSAIVQLGETPEKLAQVSELILSLADKF